MPIHPGFSAGNELAAIVADPVRYKAEIERLTQLREEAESKLRAVSLESEANALRDSARIELSKAHDVGVEAVLKAKEIVDKAKTEAASLVEVARSASLSLKAEAFAAVSQVNAHIVAADAARAEAQHLNETLQTQITQHVESAKAHDEAKQKHDIAAQLHSEMRARLENALKIVTEALK